MKEQEQKYNDKLTSYIKQISKIITDKKISNQLDSLAKNKKITIENKKDLQTIWSLIPFEYIPDFITKNKQRKKKVHAFISAILSTTTRKTIFDAENLFFVVNRCESDHFKNLFFCRGTETNIVKQLKRLDILESFRAAKPNGHSIYTLNILRLFDLFIPEVNTVKISNGDEGITKIPQKYTNYRIPVTQPKLASLPPDEFSLSLKYCPAYIEEKIYEIPDSYARIKDKYQKVRDRKPSGFMLDVAPKIEERQEPKTDEIVELLKWAMQLKHMPSHKITTKTYKNCIFWLKQLNRGTFVSSKKKVKSFLIQQELPVKKLSRPQSIKDLRKAIKRLYLLRKANDKLKTYNFADLIFNPYHPTGYYSPIMTVLNDRSWKDIQKRTAPILVSEYPKTERKFADLLHLNPELDKHDLRQLQKALKKITLFRRWLPRTGGQLDREFPINRPGRFLNSFYKFIVLDKQISIRSVWDLKLQKHLFREFLNEYYVAGSAGFAKDLSLYLDDFLYASMEEIPYGEKRVKFRREVLNPNSPNGFAFHIDQIICLPKEKADYYIKKKQAIEYTEPEPRCKSFAAPLDSYRF